MGVKGVGRGEGPERAGLAVIFYELASVLAYDLVYHVCRHGRTAESGREPVSEFFPNERSFARRFFLPDHDVYHFPGRRCGAQQAALLQ